MSKEFMYIMEYSAITGAIIAAIHTLSFWSILIFVFCILAEAFNYTRNKYY
jgi:hypothetical protein